MATTYTLKANPYQVFVVSSGASYTANSLGVITGVAAGNDLVDMVADGATVVTSSVALPYVAGRFYGLPRGGTQAAVLTVLGTLTAFPVLFPTQTTITSTNLSVTTGQTGGKVRGALFYDVNGYPGAIVPGTDTGDLAGTATAVVSKTGISITLAAGYYWFGFIATASSTMPSVIGTTAIYADEQNAILGSSSAANALATASQVSTGIAITGQTYPTVDMTTSFATFPASAALAINVTTPIAVFGV